MSNIANLEDTIRFLEQNGFERVELDKPDTQALIQEIVTSQGAGRIEHLVTTTRVIVDHFLDKKYGNVNACTSDTLPVYWSYVRYLLADRLRPGFGGGAPLFVNAGWDDKFLRDLSEESRQLEAMLPPDLNQREWFFVVYSAFNYLLKDAKMLEKRLVSETGRTNLITRTSQAIVTDVNN